MYDYFIIHLHSETIPRLGLHTPHVPFRDVQGGKHKGIFLQGNQAGFLPCCLSTLVLPRVLIWGRPSPARTSREATAWPSSSLHSPHWSARTHPLVWLSHQWLHQHGGSSSQQGHHKRSASGLSSHISEATSWSPRCPLSLTRSQQRLLLIFLELQFISAAHILEVICTAPST